MLPQKIKSPHKKWFNARWLLVLRSTLANNTRQAYNEIATGLLFGAAPNQKTLDTIGKTIDINTMVRASLLDNDEENILKPKGKENEPIRLSTFDHSTLNPNTGKHITVDDMKAFVRAVANERAKGNSVYIHCMAGRSRSMEAVTSCLYLDPQWIELAIQSDAKNMALQEKLGDDLRKRLYDPYGPLPSDIAEYIKIKRPEATQFSKLGMDRTGFLGLMTLSQEIITFKKPPLSTPMSDDRIKRAAQNIGLMLQAPLDSGFRDRYDIYQQKKDFAEMYKIYVEKGMNLLEQMLVPIGKDSRSYKENFEALSPSAKARFAILAAKVGADESRLPAGYPNPVFCALATIGNVKNLSVGDQVELLREFGSNAIFMRNGSITFESVAKRIVSGSKLDRYHAGAQLAELYGIADKMHDEVAKSNITQLFYKKLSKTEKNSYDQQLLALPTEASAKQKPPEHSGKHRIPKWIPTEPKAQQHLIDQHRAHEASPSESKKAEAEQPPRTMTI